MAVDVKKVIQELIVSELREIRLEIKGLTVEIKRLDEKIDTGLGRLDEKIDTGLSRLDEKIDSLRNEMRTEFKRLDEKIDISIDLHDRISALEAKVTSLSR